MKKISNKFHQGALTIAFFGDFLQAWHLKRKLEIAGQIFQVSILVHPSHL